MPRYRRRLPNAVHWLDSTCNFVEIRCYFHKIASFHTKIFWCSCGLFRLWDNSTIHSYGSQQVLLRNIFVQIRLLKRCSAISITMWNLLGMKIRKKDSPQVNPQPCRRSAIVNVEITAKHTTPDTRKLGEELDGEKTNRRCRWRCGKSHDIIGLNAIFDKKAAGRNRRSITKLSTNTDGTWTVTTRGITTLL